MRTRQQLIALGLICAIAASLVLAQKYREMYRTDIPPGIDIADGIETRIGALRFTDGFPDDATVEKVYDNLDFQRGVQAFLAAMPAASMAAMREGIRSLGPDNGTVIIAESLVDSRSLLLTADPEAVYAMAWLDLKKGPVVVEVPPDTVGLVNDFWSRYVAGLGDAGSDKGKGGKYVLLPPDYRGEAPEGYTAFKSRTYGTWFVARGLPLNGDAKPAAESIKRHLRIYPLAQAAKPPETKFVNVSGEPVSTVPAMDFGYFEAVGRVVQEEPAEAVDPETLGLLASIGIEKGKPFAPDERMKRILAEAAAVGSATARALAYRPRAKEAYLYPDSAWQPVLAGGSHEFLHNGARLLDARSSYFFCATGIAPEMGSKTVGVGERCAVAFTDAKKRPLDGGKTYRLHLPAGIPAKDGWSVVVYDNQTRSMLQTNQQFPSVGSRKKGVVASPDGSVDVYFGPKAPAGKEGNWVQTIELKGWNAMLRLHGPLEKWYDKTWRPGEIEEIE